MKISVGRILFFTFLVKAQMSSSLDFIIENAKIIDGTGAPWFIGGVTVSGNRIVSVGKVTEDKRGQAAVVVDADGAYLSPGFIDSHTHDDVAVLEESQHASKLLQGVTTVIIGNCGFSNYPNGENENVRAHLSSLLGEIRPENFFQNFSSYRAELRKRGVGTNVGSLVGHGPLRISVMGNDNREATESEILAMQNLLEEQLKEGALGLSTGLVYAPSTYAGEAELIALASTVAKYDKLFSAHIRGYEGNLLESIDEFLRVLKESRAKGLLSHLQVAGVPYWGMLMTSALEKLENARAEGIDIAVDMYPYLAGSSTILQLLPPSAMAGGFESFVKKLKLDPEYFEILKNATENGSEPGWESKISLIGWENVVINSVVKESLRIIQGLTIPEGAQKLGYLSKFEFCLFVVLEDEGRSNIIMHQQSEEDQRKVFQSRFQMVGSDSIPRNGGKPHPRMYGSFPRVIGTMAMANAILSLEEAVRKSTSLTAQRFGIWDRGIIRPGMVADLVMFTTEFNDTATYENPNSSPTGIQGVWVAGVRVVENSGILKTLPGVVLAS